MLGSSTIQNYFAKGDSHYIIPQTSFEWNYNLFYTPYVTTNNYYSPISIADKNRWTGSNGTTVKYNGTGRTTSVFLNDSGSSTRSCYAFNIPVQYSLSLPIPNYSPPAVAGYGNAELTFTEEEIPLTNNTYKIIFWAKVDVDAQINLSALAYVDSYRSHSSSQIIDSISWTKFEIYISPQPLPDLNYISSPKLSLHFNAPDGTTTFNVFIDQLEIHQTTDFEYQYGNLWTTSSPFNAFRPGESYVPSGNSLCQLPTDFRKIKTDLGIDSKSSTTPGSSDWNGQTMPVSPVLYHPTLLPTNSTNLINLTKSPVFNPIFKNGLLSEWSKYKYFVADKAVQSISASYDQLLYTNKIIIKFNIAYSTPSSFTVKLKGRTNIKGSYTDIYTSDTINLTNADIDSSGTCILYYLPNGTWKSGESFKLPLDITATTHTSTTATYTYNSSNQQLIVGQSVNILGISPIGYSGEFIVKAINTVISGSSYSFTVYNTTNTSITDGVGTFTRGGPWAGITDNINVSGTPSFDFNGDIKFGGSKGGTVNATVAINSIEVVQEYATINSKYSGYTNVNENMLGGSTQIDQTDEFKRMQIIEISPRLEVDVSYYTMSVSTHAELDNKQNPLPISQISSNMATVTLTNVPLTVSTGVLSLFSNNSTTSILKGLFKNYVKCYINYVILDSVPGASTNELVIPGGVFYVDTWDMNDIEKTTVTAYDISKYLQLVQPKDYVAQGQSAFNLISNILDFAGFTDYDYDSLKRVTNEKHVLTDGTQKTTSAPIRMNYFYVDGTQQKVFDVLREIFEAYQIAAYIDSYGVMKFINIDEIFNPSSPINMQLHDTKGGVTVTAINGNTINDGYANNLTIDPNIIVDTYTETTKTKVGKATFTYKTPQIEKTISSDSRLLTNNLYVDYAPTFMDSTNAIWDSSTDEVVTFNTLAATMNKSDTVFQVPSNEATAASNKEPIFRTYGIDHNGYAIIENEIVSFQYKEFNYTNGKGLNEFRSVLNSADFSAKFAEISSLAGNNEFAIKATGKITNVNRGQFNTSVSDHIVMSSTSDILKRFVKESDDLNPTISKDGNIILKTNKKGITTSLFCDDFLSNTGKNPYNTFSTKIKAGPNSGTNYPDNTSYGLIIQDENNKKAITVLITQILSSKGKIKYLLDVIHSDNYVSMLVSPVDVTTYINGEGAYPLNSPFEDYGKYINLKFVNNLNPDDFANNLDPSDPNKFNIYLNKYHIPLKIVSNYKFNVSGIFGITAIVKAESSSTSNASVEFSELYATQTALSNPNILYHYQLPWFAEKLASNKKISEVSYMVQSRPSIVGINYYDIQDTQAPSFDAYPLKLSYNWYYYVDGNAPDIVGQNSKLTDAEKNLLEKKTGDLPYISVDENALSYSPIYHSGFRSRFAIVNCSPSQVWIRKSPDTLNKINVDFSLITRSLIVLGDDVVIEKVFDVANINETVDIKSNWVQDKNTAVSILKTIYRALEGFSRDTSLSVYGNPLYEIGDIVVVNYKLKNIINQKYIVQGISQTFDTGLKTVLVLNEIDSGSIKLPNTYSKPAAQLNQPIAGSNVTSESVTTTPLIFSVNGVTGNSDGSFTVSCSNFPSGTNSYRLVLDGPNLNSIISSSGGGYNSGELSTSITSVSYTGAKSGTTYNIYAHADTAPNVSISDATTTVVAGGSTTLYTVTFNANGGSGTMSSQSSSSATVLNSNTFTYTNKKFSGWNTAIDGTGTTYSDNATYPFTSSTTLYAQWGQLYTVTFNANGGTNPPSPITQTSPGAPIILPNRPIAPDGYSFGNWYEHSPLFFAGYIGSAYYPNANVTLYANYYPISF